MSNGKPGQFLNRKVTSHVLIVEESLFLIHFHKEVAKNSKARQGAQKQFD